MAAATAPTADNTRSGNGLLSGTRCFGRWLRSPWLFALLFTVRLFPARLCIVLVIVLASRGSCRRRRFLHSYAAPTFRRLACLAFERANATGLLGQIGDQPLGYVSAVRGMSLEGHVPPKRVL